MNGYLLDTHVLLWWFEEPESISKEARRAIESRTKPLVVSVASIWELAIKQAIGEFRVPDDFIALIDAEGFRVLPIVVEHAIGTGALPLHHRDPFDRMLIAQAKVEGLTILTRDDAFPAYGVPCIRA